MTAVMHCLVLTEIGQRRTALLFSYGWGDAEMFQQKRNLNCVFSHREDRNFCRFHGCEKFPSGGKYVGFDRIILWLIEIFIKTFRRQEVVTDI